jgi:hypothetical protein
MIYLAQRELPPTPGELRDRVGQGAKGWPGDGLPPGEAEVTWRAQAASYRAADWPS